MPAAPAFTTWSVGCLLARDPHPTSCDDKMSTPLALALAAVAALAASPAASQVACKEFPEIRAAIDNVIDKDPAKGAHFRKEFKDGADSIHIMEQLVDEAMRKKIYVCRFDVAEYLTKRGFPPPH